MLDFQNIEVICMDDNQNHAIEIAMKSFDWLNVKIILDSKSLKNHLLFNTNVPFSDKYSIGLYFKSWLKNYDHDSEHLQLIISSIEKGGVLKIISATVIQRSWFYVD